MKYFRLEELVPKDVYAKEGQDAWLHFDTGALIMLDNLREFFGVPLTINNWLWMSAGYQYRGYRPPDCKVGAAGSYHRKGRAFDFDVKGMTAEAARHMMLIDQKNPLLSSVRRVEGTGNWVHVDTGSPPEQYAGKGIYVFRV